MILSPLVMLERLVAFDTESSKSNLPLIDFVEGYLSSWGVETWRFPSADGQKASLFAHIGPKDRGGVLLSGHTDVVPVIGQAWTGDPFALRVMDGKAIGRGAVDMKGYLALCLSAVPNMLKSPLKTPIHLLLSYDEETTCLGPLEAIRHFGSDLPMPIACFVGEPTGMEVVDAHKSVQTFDTLVTGLEAHSSKPALGASAVMAACDLVAFLSRMSEEFVARGDASGRFDPAYSTIHIGIIEGGTARNILAKECRFVWEVRGLPDLDEAEVPQRLTEYAETIVLPHIRRSAPSASITTINHVSVPGLKPDTGSFAETLALRLAGRNRTLTVPYASEAGHFQQAGVPTVLCGPGSIDQAHQADEYITFAALEQGEIFIQRLIETCRA